MTPAHTGKFVAYYRVSTQRQGRSGLGLEAQQTAVRDYLNGGNWRLVAEVTEVESGKRSDRPKLAEALKLCRLHSATLIIAKLDRLARNVAFISKWRPVSSFTLSIFRKPTNSQFTSSRLSPSTKRRSSQSVPRLHWQQRSGAASNSEAIVAPSFLRQCVKHRRTPSRSGRCASGRFGTNDCRVKSGGCNVAEGHCRRVE